MTSSMTSQGDRSQSTVPDKTDLGPRLGLGIAYPQWGHPSWYVFKIQYLQMPSDQWLYILYDNKQDVPILIITYEYIHAFIWLRYKNDDDRKNLIGLQETVNLFATTVRSRYNAVNFLQSPHKGTQ